MAKAGQVKFTNVIVYVLIGLLIVGLAGFGIGGFSTSVRAVGSVGDQDITVDDYVRALQSEIDSFSRITGTRLSAADAVSYGFDRQALERLLLQAAVDNEAANLGLSLGDERVLAALQAMEAFQGVDGRFDRDSYDFVLERSGLSHAEFDEIVRREQTRSIIRSSIAGGFRPSNSFLNDQIESHLNTRDFRWVSIGSRDLPEPVPSPTAADLRAHYDDNPERFTDPEMRDVTYVWLTPEMISGSIEVDEGSVRAEYDARADEYDIPPRRAVDRLVFPSMEEARSAMERFDAGDIGFIGLLEERRVALEDAELGVVGRSDLAAAAADLLFGSSDTGLFGPVESELGPAIFRVNAVLEGRFTPFEDAKAELTEELALELARDRIADSIESHEDLLAGGATLEELASETELRLDRIRLGPESDEGIAERAEFRAAVASLSEDDFPELANLADGGVFAVRLDGVVPPALRPFDEAKEDVSDAWVDHRLAELLRGHAEDILNGLKSGKGFAELGFEPNVEEETGRLSYIADAPPGMVEDVFGLKVGEAAVVGEGQEVGLVLLDSVNRVDLDGEAARSLRDALGRQFAASTGDDVFRLYSEFLQRDAGIRIDHAIIESIHTQLY